MPFRPAVSTVFSSLRPHPTTTTPRCLLFYTSSRFHDAANHYDVLGVSPSASPADVKKQFYALSKKHHPDRNPHDPEASHKFAKISEAYTVLGNTQKRQRYDRDTYGSNTRGSGSGSGSGSEGSRGPSSGPAGGRPASGLSRRRTQFRGPPPSFYRSGGWGESSAKRERQAYQTHEPGHGQAPGHQRFGAGQGASFGDDDYIPHFDRQSHFRTQEQQDEYRRRRRARDSIPVEPGSGTFINFVFVGGIVSLAIALPTFLYNAATVGSNEEKVVRRK